MKQAVQGAVKGAAPYSKAKLAVSTIPLEAAYPGKGGEPRASIDRDVSADWRRWA